MTIGKRLAIIGPTASGKSSLALSVCRRLGDAEIVSIDAMQVYRGMDIGTASPSPAERTEVRHHLVDLVDPHEEFTLAQFQSAYADAVADIDGRGRRAVLVGGTGLYLRAVTDGLTLPGQWPEIRRRLEAEAERSGPEPMFERLRSLDAQAATRMEPTNVRRIVRALEVCTLTGQPLSAVQTPAHDPIFETRVMILDVSRDELAKRIDRRVERMFANGLIEEAEAALASPGGIGFTARQAPGYTEAIELLAGRIDRVEAIRRTQLRTRQLAKRQRTWFRSFKNATWIGA